MCGQFNNPLLETIFKVQFNIDQQKAMSGILMQMKFKGYRFKVWNTYLSQSSGLVSWHYRGDNSKSLPSIRWLLIPNLRPRKYLINQAKNKIHML